MDKKAEIMEKLKNAFPNLEVSILTTNQRGDRKLIIVKGFSLEGDIDDWSINIVYPIWYKMMEILEQYEGGMRDFRLMFVRGNQFMLHSPEVGRGAVFRHFKKAVRKDVYGDEKYRHYVGECSDINDVLEYLTQTQTWF